MRCFLVDNLLQVNNEALTESVFAFDLSFQHNLWVKWVDSTHAKFSASNLIIHMVQHTFEQL